MNNDPSTRLYEDILSTVRLSALAARRLHHPEHAPLAWLEAFIEGMQRLGWVTVNRVLTEHLYTPAPSVWMDVFSGRVPQAQPRNTRFKTLVRHVIDARSDGNSPLPRLASDDNKSTHLLTQIQMPVAAPPTLRLVQLAGAPDPQAPKTRLPLARTCWQAALDIQRFEAQRPLLEHALLSLEQAIEGL